MGIRDRISQSSGFVLISVLTILNALIILALAMRLEVQTNIILVKALKARHERKQDFWEAFSAIFESEEKFVNKVKTTEDFDVFKQESQLNINSLSLEMVDVFVRLIVSLGYSQETGKEIAYSILDWKDRDGVLSHEIYGAEKEYYEKLKNPYRNKNYYFESKEELLLVRGMEKGIFESLKDLITIFPYRSRFKINLLTCPEIFLRAFANSIAFEMKLSDPGVVESLLEKIFWDREQKREKLGVETLSLTTEERALLTRIKKYHRGRSPYVSIEMKGKSEDFKSINRVRAVIRKNDHKIMAWNVY